MDTTKLEETAYDREFLAIRMPELPESNKLKVMKTEAKVEWSPITCSFTSSLA